MSTLQRPSQSSSRLEKDEENDAASDCESRETPSFSQGGVDELCEAHGTVYDNLAGQFAHVAMCDTRIERSEAEGESEEEVEDDLSTAFLRQHFVRIRDALSSAEDPHVYVLSCAVVAAKFCETARVATEEASRAVARMLLEVLEAAHSAPVLVEFIQVCGIHAGSLAGCLRTSTGPVPGPIGLSALAVAKGDILAWCKVRILEKKVHCEMDITKFIDIDAYLTSIGISRHLPLTVTVFLYNPFPVPAFPVPASCEQQAKLENELSHHDSSSNSESLGLKYLVPHVVSSYLKSTAQSGSSNNIFIGLMQSVAWYLSNLSFICCICQKRCSMPSGKAQTCRQNPCMATFENWDYVARNNGQLDRCNCN